jgi:hypothetical protein
MTFLENSKTNKIEYLSRKKANRLLLYKETVTIQAGLFGAF